MTTERLDRMQATVPWLTGRRASAGAAPSSRRRAPATTPATPTQPVGRATVDEPLPGRAVAGRRRAIVVVALVAILVVFQPLGPGPAAAAALGAAPGLGQPGALGSAARPARPASRPALPAGETRTVTLTTPKGAIAIKVEADLSPIAAGNFVALASCGFYDGTVFHRTRDAPGRHAVRHPGRRSGGHRDRRPGLHHHRTSR